MDKLKKFTIDKEMVNQVKGYLIHCLQEKTLDRVFITGEDVTGLKEAGEIISSFFDKMESEFADKIEKKNIQENI